jgi:Flp pilus assembly protein TadD
LATVPGGDARAWHHRGAIEAALGMTAQAERHLRRALGVDAGYSPWQAQQVRLILANLGAQS